MHLRICLLPTASGRLRSLITFNSSFFNSKASIGSREHANNPPEFLKARRRPPSRSSKPLPQHPKASIPNPKGGLYRRPVVPSDRPFLSRLCEVRGVVRHFHH